MTLEELDALPKPLGEEHQTAVRQHVLRNMAELADAYYGSREGFRHRPLIGGAFGSGRFTLSSFAYTHAGLDEVRYFVIDLVGHLFVGFGRSKQEALAGAREFLGYMNRVEFEVFAGKERLRRNAEAAEQRRQHELAREEWRAQNRRSAERIKSIPKRRREIFDKSEGKCHYCAAALTLDGNWHIEHMQPRALLGSNDKSNLVASCVSCNHQKRDMTAEEFIAKRSQA